MPHPGGRPTKYDPRFVPIAQAMTHLGATMSEIAEAFEVTTQTIYGWQHTYPEFFDALKMGKEAPDERVKQSLYHRACGYTFDSEKLFMPAGAKEPVRVPIKEHVPPDTAAAFIWLKNRKGWRDRPEVTDVSVTRTDPAEVDAPAEPGGVQIHIHFEGE